MLNRRQSLATRRASVAVVALALLQVSVQARPAIELKMNRGLVRRESTIPFDLDAFIAGPSNPIERVVTNANQIQTSIDQYVTLISRGVEEAGIRVNSPDGSKWIWSKDGSTPVVEDSNQGQFITTTYLPVIPTITFTSTAPTVTITSSPTKPLQTLTVT